MKRLACVVLMSSALAVTLTSCGAAEQTPEQKVDAAIARLGADRATLGQQKVIDFNFGPPDQVLNRTIYLVPKKDSPVRDGSDVWIIDEQGEIFDSYYAFLRDNDLTR